MSLNNSQLILCKSLINSNLINEFALIEKIKRVLTS